LSFELDQQEGEFLIHLARQATEQYLKTKRCIPVPTDTPVKLLQPCGVFVTISIKKNHEKELRGCIGLPYPTSPLIEAVIQAAISAATEDPRFYPLDAKELDQVVFEVSVLTPPTTVETEKPTEYPNKIKVGKDGLIIEKGMYKGLLLPQVPVECGWNEKEFLCQCSVKAGLPPDCWLQQGTRVHKFQAIIFEELTPKGRIERKTLSGNQP
jgi:uncharacterized protein (TIGR00296 family)